MDSFIYSEKNGDFAIGLNPERTTSMTLEENVHNLMTASEDDFEPSNTFNRLINESNRVLVEPVSLLQLTSQDDNCNQISDIFPRVMTECETKDDFEMPDSDDVSIVASRILFEGIAEESAVDLKTSISFVENATESSRYISTNEIESSPKVSISIKKEFQQQNLTKAVCASINEPINLRRSQRKLNCDVRHSNEKLAGKNVEEKAMFLKAKQNAIGETFDDNEGFIKTPQFRQPPKTKKLRGGAAHSKTATTSSEDDEEDNTPLARCFAIVKRESPNPSTNPGSISRSCNVPASVVDDKNEKIHKHSSEEDVSGEEAEGEPIYCFTCAKIGMPIRMVICATCRNTFHSTCEGVKTMENLKGWTCRSCSSSLTLSHKIKRKHDNLSYDKTKKLMTKFRKQKSDFKLSTTKDSYSCIVCKKNFVRQDDSIFCSEACIEKIAEKFFEHFKDSTHRVTMIEKSGSNQILKGINAPMVKDLATWLKKHRRFYPDLNDANMKAQSTPRRESDNNSVASSTNVANLNIDQVRLAVRKTLRDCLINRSKGADDVLLSNEEIKRVAVDIENEMFKNCGDTSMNYRHHFKGLVVNLKDVKNRGFFRRILNGTLTARKVAAMSGQEMAARENSFWATSDDEDASKVNDNRLGKSKDFTNTKAEADSTCDIFGLLVGDTTDRHKSHLFDLNCKICTGKQKCDVDLLGNPSQNELKVNESTSLQRDTASIEYSQAANSFEQATANLDYTKSLLTKTVPTGDSQSTMSAIPSFDAHRKVSTKLSVDEEEYVWGGVINMPGYFRFDISFIGVSGKVHCLKRELPTHLKIVGRIPSEVVFDYVKSLKTAPSKDVLVVRIEEQMDKSSYVQYRGLYDNMVNKERFCVVDTSRMTKIKDMYLLPLSSNHAPDPALLPFDGLGLPVPRNDLIIGIIIRRRDRSDYAKNEAPPVPQVPENLKSKLSKTENHQNAYYNNALSTSDKLPKYSDSGILAATENDTKLSDAVKSSICQAQSFHANIDLSITPTAAPAFPEVSHFVNFLRMQENIKTELDRHYTIEQSGPNCSKDEWVRCWNNSLTYCQSKVVTPTNVSVALVPSQFETTSSLCQPLSRLSTTVSKFKFSTHRQLLEDGEIMDDDEEKQKMQNVASSSQVESKHDVDWRRLNRTLQSSDYPPQTSITSFKQMDEKLLMGVDTKQLSDIDYRIRDKE